MKHFLALPIRQKMLVITLFICGAVLCFAVAALFSFQVLNFRSNFQRDTETLATVIANNSTAAIVFNDEQTAAEVVGAVRAKPTVIAANLVLTNGSLFAHFGPAENSQALAQFPPSGDYRFVGGQLLLTQPVKVKGEQVGTLYLRSDYRKTFLKLLGVYGLVVLGIVTVSIPLAAFLSRRLGRAIANPVLALAQTAQTVGEKKDYSVRAVVSSRGDELGGLAESFNEMLSRIQSQDAALGLSQAKMEALIHSIDGIVWERTPDTFHFNFVSRQSKDILGYAPEAWLEQANFWEEKLHPQDAAKAIRTAREMAAKAEPYTHEYRMMSADGHTVWIRESGTVIVEKGKAVAVRGIYLDITRERVAAEQLDKLNRQLMDTSRQAGMAEVATGVLHNVGNVLNSVSVAATLVGERLRGSKLANLRKTAALLREHSGQLGEFLTTDPKGKLIPEYIATVTEQMAAEQAKLVEKMDSVGQHIEHIKEIVAMQQNYAKISGVYQDLPLAGLVEDALRMNAAAFDRHGIELVKEISDDIPLARVDRHKVLQILVNLLRNAKYAMDGHPGGGGHVKRLTVRVKAAAPERVSIIVADTGVGIAAENLTKIFNHGFTTKKDGHGFGLHSGANAAKEMGGTLKAHSPGPGQGAEFTLELPAATSVREEPSDSRSAA